MGGDRNERDTHTNQRLEVESLQLPSSPPGEEMGDLLLACLDPDGDWRYGDRLRLEGTLNFEGPFAVSHAQKKLLHSQ